MLIATSPCANALGTADPVPVFNCITLGILFLLLYKYVSYQKVPPLIIPSIFEANAKEAESAVWACDDDNSNVIS